MIASIAGLLLAAGGVSLWLLSSGEFYFEIRLAAEAASGFKSGQPIPFEVATSRPIFLIEITIDPDMKINSRVPPGPRDGRFADGDQIALTPKVPGEFDVYLVPCDASEGFPNRLHGGLLEFLKTENALSRENRRQGIKTALDLYRVRFFHQTLKIGP